MCQYGIHINICNPWITLRMSDPYRELIRDTLFYCCSCVKKKSRNFHSECSGWLKVHQLTGNIFEADSKREDCYQSIVQLLIVIWLVVEPPLWKIWVRPNWMESHKIPWFQSPPTSHSIHYLEVKERAAHFLDFSAYRQGKKIFECPLCLVSKDPKKRGSQM